MNDQYNHFKLCECLDKSETIGDLDDDDDESYSVYRTGLEEVPLAAMFIIKPEVFTYGSDTVNSSSMTTYVEYSRRSLSPNGYGRTEDTCVNGEAEPPPGSVMHLPGGKRHQA